MEYQQQKQLLTALRIEVLWGNGVSKIQYGQTNCLYEYGNSREEMKVVEVNEWINKSKMGDHSWNEYSRD